MLFYIQLLLLALLPQIFAWLPNNKIRGVNLGGLFIIEPWMMTSEWQAMGCGAYESEFDCVAGLGQQKANLAFRKHWNTWITQADFAEMKSYGINTVRIPLGYWMKESLVYRDSEHFATGAFRYLERAVGWARDAGIYVILDLHGAPGAQTPLNAFTGQYAPTAAFYQSYQYDRAYQFITWLTTVAHTNPKFSSVGAIELLNEPLAWQPSITGTLSTNYYPTAISKIRAIESQLNIPASKRFHIMMMNEAWGAGNPLSNVQDQTNVLLDDHHYVKWDTSVTPTCDAYMTHSCTNSRLIPGQKIPQITGEWSLSVADAYQTAPEFSINPMSANTKAFYVNWFTAQMQTYEQSQGWIYWAWKITLDDWRWGYQAGVRAGVIPKDLNTIKAVAVCSSYKAKRDELEKEEAVIMAAPAFKNATGTISTPVSRTRRRMRHSHHKRVLALS